MFSGGFHQMLKPDTNPQLTIPTALAKETSGLIHSKEMKTKLLTCGNEKEQAIKLLVRNVLIYQDKFEKKW
jgi:hypothetical protein